jgi:hypothetical protein
LPPRKGLNADYPQVGMGGLCFLTTMNFMNIEMTYEQRIWMLESEYYVILAKIEDNETITKDADIKRILNETRALLDQAGRDYLSSFEDHKTHSEDENNFRKLLCQTFGKIAQLLGKTKMIEKEKVTQEVFY